MSAFAATLQEQLEKKTDRSEEENQLLGILQGPETFAKKRKVRRLEKRAQKHLGFTGDPASIDWSTIDWSTILLGLLKVLVALLPLLLLAKKPTTKRGG